jgi:hypothetical protein
MTFLGDQLNRSSKDLGGEKKEVVVSRIGTFAAFLAFLSVPLVWSSGCAEESPEDRVAKLRARYKAELNGFIVRAQPLEEFFGGEMAGKEMAEEEGMELGPESGEEVAETPVQVRQDVLLDILLQHDSTERLDGVTLDIHMVDPSQREKGHWLLWVDTSTLEKATHIQFTHVLEDSPYEEGDGFAVEVRHPIPVEERGDYREFAAPE